MAIQACLVHLGVCQTQFTCIFDLHVRTSTYRNYDVDRGLARVVLVPSPRTHASSQSTSGTFLAN